MEYRRTSISSFSASFLALSDGRTWNPTIIAFDAAASRISDSEIWPTALWMTLSWISGVDSLIRESLRASTEPSTSPLTMIFSSWKLPIAILRPISSRVICFWVRSPCSLCSWALFVAISLASRSLSIMLNLSPAWGAPFSPKIRVGVAGPTSSTLLPLSLYIALIWP